MSDGVPRSADALLEAVARFLGEDVRGQVTDKAVAFRLRVAESLLKSVAREVRRGEGALRLSLERLDALARDLDPSLDPVDLGPSASPEAVQAGREACERAIGQALRLGTSSDDQLERARATLLSELRDELAVIDPRFDTSLKVE